MATKSKQLEKLSTQRLAIDDLCNASASALSKAYAQGSLSPVEVAKATLKRAHDIKGAVNAFTLIDDEGALKQAQMSEDRWQNGTPLSPIDGVPTTIKDIVHCGLDVRYGSNITDDITELPDAPSVKFLRAAGAMMLGLTNMPEFGWKAVTDNRKFGTTLNPWDTTKTPGGSSGGAAVAAAMGAGALHLGTDGGGSIRIPAAFTGIVGHKPSFGRVAAFPASSFGTVAHIGPMARTVEDTVLMLNAMQGRDMRDWHQGNSCVAPINPEILDLKDVRIGYWRNPPIGNNHSEVQQLVDNAVAGLEAAGAKIDIIQFPHEEELLQIFYKHWHVGAANRLSQIDKIHHNKIDPGFIQAAQNGAQYSSVERMKAEISRAEFGAAMDQLLSDYAFIVSPTVPIPAFEADHDVPPQSDYKSWVEWSSYSFPINLSQQPACSVPCGLTKAGLPVGLQIIGARGADEYVLSAALTYQDLYPNHFILAQNNWPPAVKELD